VAPGSSLQTAKRWYAATARATGRALTRAGVLGDEPPPLRHRAWHWGYSLTKVHDSLEIARLGVPWWTYRAIDAVSEWLEPGRPVRVFEYGSGASTLWLADRATEVHSVEHHRGFATMMARELAARSHVTLHLVEPRPSTAPVVPSAKEGYAGLDFSAYVRVIEEVPGEFDLVVIDGRAREACLAAASGRLADGGIVVFDNTLRRRYRAAIRATGMVEQRHFGLTPTLPYPDQTSLLRLP
jgi:hypothetical protein